MIKVFCAAPQIQGYTAENTFHIAVDYTIYSSLMDAHADSVSIDFPLDTNPVMTYAGVYTHILDTCTRLGFETPGKEDIFCFIPVPFYMVI